MDGARDSPGPFSWTAGTRRHARFGQVAGMPPVLAPALPRQAGRRDEVDRAEGVARSDERSVGDRVRQDADTEALAVGRIGRAQQIGLRLPVAGIAGTDRTDRNETLPGSRKLRGVTLRTSGRSWG